MPSLKSICSLVTASTYEINANQAMPKAYLNFFTQTNTAHFKMSSWSIWQVTQN